MVDKQVIKHHKQQGAQAMKAGYEQMKAGYEQMKAGYEQMKAGYEHRIRRWIYLKTGLIRCSNCGRLRRPVNSIYVICQKCSEENARSLRRNQAMQRRYYRHLRIRTFIFRILRKLKIAVESHTESYDELD